MNFWQDLKQKNTPIIALAPLAGITDAPFRQICKSFGADVVYSEMASSSALVYKPEKTLGMLRSCKKENPFVVQLFGAEPKNFFKSAKLISDETESQKYCDDYLLPQGIDINFGCPVRKVQKQGAGAVLMNDLRLAREIIKSVLAATDLPVSIKTRTTAGKYDVLQFLDNISDLPVGAIMIHGRTLAQGFSGEINSQIIKEARNYFSGIILANGGISNFTDVDDVLRSTRADGIGVARGCLGKPWIFEEIKKMKKQDKDIFEIKKIIFEHLDLAIKYFGEPGVKEFRKHLCWYVQGLTGARALRQELVKANTAQEIKHILK